MKKAIHFSIIMVILVFIIFTALMINLKYDETGETNMPFTISKISIISNTDASDNEDNENLWNKTVHLNNDIYFYIEKNPDYKKQELIKNIKIKNVSFSPISKGTVKKFKPCNNEKLLFENKDEFDFDELIFSGSKKTEIQNYEISNQGGIIAFRVSNLDLGTLISNDNELNYKYLLKGLNLSFQDLQFTVSLDLILALENGNEFKTNIKLELPCESIVENGTSSKEITDNSLVYKRINA